VQRIIISRTFYR